MRIAETFTCGATLTLELTSDEPRMAPAVDSVEKFRLAHVQCRRPQQRRAVDEAARQIRSRQAWDEAFPPPGWPDPPEGWTIDMTSRTVTPSEPWPEAPEDVDPERFFELVGRRAAHDPYGPSEVPDSMRLSLVADYVARINSARGVENRVPDDLRRIASVFAAAEVDEPWPGWPEPPDTDDVPLRGLRQLLSALNETRFTPRLNVVDGRSLNVYVAKGDFDPNRTWCNAVWSLTTGEVRMCEWSHVDDDGDVIRHTLDIPALAAWIRDGMPT